MQRCRGNASVINNVFTDKLKLNGKYIIFDMDGILFDTEGVTLVCWDKASDEYGYTGVSEVARECIGTSSKRTKEIITSHFGSDFPYDDIRSRSRILLHEIFVKNGMPIKKGAFELLEWLTTDKWKKGLATSTSSVSAEWELRSCDMYKYFDNFIYGDQITRSKPEPDIFLNCASAMKAEPSSTFVVEDSYNGIRAASSAKMIPLMVPDLLPVTDEMKTLAFSTFNDLYEVKNFLAELSEQNF
jgi:beta-phosphoglucomutase-like phosphatase (HAD superfamily)